MDIPGIGRKKIDETQQSEETQNQQTESSKNETSSGIAAEADLLQSAADEGKAYFESGWEANSSREVEQHSGLGNNPETQSLVVGLVTRSTERSGAGWIRMGYTSPNVQLGGKEVDIDLTVDAIISFEKIGGGLDLGADLGAGFALELSLGNDSHVEIGLDKFTGLSARPLLNYSGNVVPGQHSPLILW